MTTSNRQEIVVPVGATARRQPDRAIEDYDLWLSYQLATDLEVSAIAVAI